MKTRPHKSANAKPRKPTPAERFRERMEWKDGDVIFLNEISPQDVPAEGVRTIHVGEPRGPPKP